MSEVISLVRGDTRPQLIVNLTDERLGGAPVDLSGASCVIRMRLRERGSAVVKEILTCVRLPGLEAGDGSVDVSGIYAAAGRGGRVAVNWTATALDTAGNFEGEFEVEFAPGDRQTVYAVQRFRVRPDF